MQAIMETIFESAYLITVITLGVRMIIQGRDCRERRLFGIMAVVLGCGDSFHLLPRMYALWTTGMEANAAALGFGQMVTSITMTCFYVILFFIWRIRYRVAGAKGLTACILVLAGLRIGLCLFPQNRWLDYDAPLSWGIYRNIPFAILGLLVILIFFSQAKLRKDQVFRFMWLAISLSFAFYIPVVLFAGTYPIVGMLMLPKTCAYVWMVYMGYKSKPLS